MPNESTKLPAYCMGWRSEPAAVDLWHPEIPKSYKAGGDASKEWMKNTLDKAPMLPFVGRPVEIVVLNAHGNIVFEGGPVPEFLRFVESVAGYSEMSPWETDPEPRAIFVGFNPKELFVSVAMILLRDGITVPTRFWRHNPGLVDIYETLVPGDLRNGFTTASLLAFMGEDFADPELLSKAVSTDGVEATTTLERARIAWTLAGFAQLL